LSTSKAIKFEALYLLWLVFFGIELDLIGLIGEKRVLDWWAWFVGLIGLIAGYSTGALESERGGFWSSKSAKRDVPSAFPMARRWNKSKKKQEVTKIML
jgi:hypothetical protein